MTNIFADTVARVWGPTMAISARHTAGRCCQPLSFIFFEQCELYSIPEKPELCFTFRKSSLTHLIGQGVQGQHQSQHSSFNNTPVPQVSSSLNQDREGSLTILSNQEFTADFPGVEGGELEMSGMEEKVEGQADNIITTKRKDNDDLDLALDALRDCDTDFSKFVQVPFWSLCNVSA